jgi:membrane peptidoglycan carboxypeptidase
MRIAPRRANRLAARTAKRLGSGEASRPGATRTAKYGNLFGVAALSGAMLAGVVMPVVGVAAIETKKAAASFNNLPDQLPTLTPASASVILASDGTQIATFYDADRINEPLTSIAPLMQQAQLAIEDYRFYQHGAIDFEGTLRALLRNSGSGHQQGGSDLTQQYVKNVLIQAANGDPDKIAAAQADTLTRKMQELRYAGEVQKEMTKDQILDAYLNIAFYGDNAYGVEAAARHYFSTESANLTLPEAALLAGIVQDPTEYNPVLNPGPALTRRNEVLTRMRDVGDITTAQMQQAQAQPLGLRVEAAHSGCDTSQYAFFCDYVVHVIENDPTFGATEQDRENLLYEGGLTIKTTLDPQAQQSADAALAAATNPTDKAQAALATVQPGTGRVLAIAQSRAYGTGKNETTVDYAVDHVDGGSNGFQDGSTNKAFTAAAALEEGYGTEYKIDSPNSIGGFAAPTNCDGKRVATGNWHPGNDEVATDYGPVITMREALRKSVNTYFAQLEAKVGLCSTVQAAEAAGEHRADGTPLQEYLPFTLGFNEVSPLDIADSYATFAAQGTQCNPIAIDAITNSAGKTLAVPSADCHQAFTPAVANTVTDMLHSVMEPGGTGADANLDDNRPAAGKTGTTNGAVAVWFTGFTPQMATSIWVGDPDNYGYKMANITIGGKFYSQVCGACVAAPIWQQMMNGALNGMPVVPLPAPDPATIIGTQGQGDPRQAHITYKFKMPSA